MKKRHVSTFLFLLMTAHQAQAQSWVGPATNGGWSNAANWNPGGAPTSSTTTALTFSTVASTIQDLGSPFQFNTLTVSNTVTISGSSLELAGAGAQIIKNTNNNLTLNSLLNVTSANASFAGSSTEKILLPGGIFVAAGANLNLNGRKLEKLSSLMGSGTITGFTQDLKIETAGGTFAWDGTLSGTGNRKLEIRGGTHLWGNINDFAHKVELKGGSNLTLRNGGQLTGITELTLDGGTLVLDNTATNLGDRIRDAAPIKIKSGPTGMTLLGHAGVATSEAFGVATLEGEAQTTFRVVNGVGGTATLTLDNFTRTKRGGTVNFTGDGTTVITNGTTTHGILGGWALRGSDWATLDGAKNVVAFSAYQTGDNPNTWADTDNVLVNGGLTGSLTASKTVHTLKYTSTDTLTLDPGTTLTLGGGGLLATADGIITGGSLTASFASESGKFELFIHAPDATTNFTIGSNIVNTGTDTTLLKTGEGTVTLSGVLQHKETLVLDGTLVLDTGAGTTTLSNHKIKGSGVFEKSGTGTLILSGGTKLETTGAITIRQGTLQLVGDKLLKKEAHLHLQTGTVLDLRSGAEQEIGRLTGDGLILGSETTNKFLIYGFDNQNANFAGQISGTQQGVLATGTGIKKLTGENTYGGGTTVDFDSTLLVSNMTGSGTGTGPVTVRARGLLGGNGTIAGAVNVAANGILAPGESPGILTIGGLLTMSPGAILLMEFDGSTPGIGAGFHDQLVLANGGSADLSDALLELNFLTDPNVDLDLVLIRNLNPSGGITGTFAGLPEGATLALGAMFSAQISYVGGDGNDVVLFNFQTIPEPGTWLLILLALAVVLSVRSRGMLLLLRASRPS